MRILCIGDSNTYGYDPRSYLGDRYPAEIRWTDRLENCEVINCGVNGLTVPREHARYIGLVRMNDPDLVIVMLGTNDFFRGLSDDELVEESEDLGELYRVLAERNHCLFADAGKWNIEMTYDGVHFSPEGHAAFAQKLNELLLQI